MAGKVSRASEQVNAWLERYKNSGNAELTLDAARDAIRAALPDNPVAQALTRDSLRMRAVRINLYFRETGRRRISDASQKLNDWLVANCAKHSLKSAVAAIKIELGQDVRPDVLGMRKRALGLAFGESDAGSVAKPPSDWLARGVISALSAKRPPANLKSLAKRIVAGLSKQLAGKAGEITEAGLLEELDELYWSAAGRADMLTNAIKAGYDAKTLHKLLGEHWYGSTPLPPLWVLVEKLKAMHGRVSAPRMVAKAIPGILRAPIANARPYALGGTSFKEPLHALPEHGGTHLQVDVIAAPQLGLPYDPDIERNLLRSGFSAARKAGSHAIVMGGGLFRLSWLKTSGPNRLLADLVTGAEADVESIDRTYRDEMTRIIESGSFEPIFLTALEQFNELLRGWYKITRRPGNRPEFEGPVYIILNPDDLGLVRRMAYFELLYQQHLKMLEAQANARLLAKLAAEAFQHGTPEQAAKAEAEAEDAARLASRFRMSNLDPTQNRRVYDQALSYLIERIEANVANAKVVDQNSAFLRFGASAHVLKFVSAGESANPYYGELANYGPTQRRGEMPAYTVVMHPRAVYPRKTSRENYLEGSMLGTVGAAEAPMLVDPGPILERTRGTRVHLPVTKAVADPMFNGGMLRVGIHPELGVTADFLSVETVRTFAAPRQGTVPATKRCYLMVATDRHFGGSMQTTLKQASGLPMSLTDAVFELIRKDGMAEGGIAPVAGLFICDDILHGNHFGTHTRPHYDRRPYADILREADRVFAGLADARPALREKRLRALAIDLMNQLRVRVPDFLTGQMEELFPFLRANKDVIKGMLLYAKNIGVSVRGVGQIMGKVTDMRDTGLINLGSGNHFTKTTLGMLHEGPVVAELIRAELRGDPALAGLDLDRLIRAPLFQDQAIGYGSLQVADGYTWGLHVTGTPPKRDSWIDTLHGWVQVNRQRGNPSSVLDRMSIVHVCGDKHFSAGAFAGGDLYVMGSSATHTDGFAEIAGGLTENTAGVDFIGLPVDGPDSGDIRIVHLTPGVIQRFLLSGETFPWDDLLPHRA